MTERELWGAVLQQAIDDAHFAFSRPDDHDRGATNMSLVDKSDARAFVTATYGAWARSRMDICHVSGIDPDAFFQRCAASLNEHGDLRDLIPPKLIVTPEEKNRRRTMKRRREAAALGCQP